MTQQRAQRAYFGPTWPEVVGFGEAPQQAALRDCGHSHIACRFVTLTFKAYVVKVTFSVKEKAYIIKILDESRKLTKCPMNLRTD